MEEIHSEFVKGNDAWWVQP